jgi:DNA-binding response OmpR family regulator
VLVISQESRTSDIVIEQLTQLGSEPTLATSAKDGAGLAQSQGFALLVVDIELPDFDGTAVCRAVRAAGVNMRTPVLVLSARNREADVVLALESGADAFVQKPISARELRAHLRALLMSRERGEQERSREVLRAGDVELDVEGRQALVCGRPVSLTRREFDLLMLLLRHPGSVFSRRALASRIWGDAAEVSHRAVDIAICRLRHQIERDPRRPSLIVTVRGQGYQLVVGR